MKNYPNGETFIIPSIPFGVRAPGAVTAKPAAKVGAHTAKLLHGLGYSAEQLASLQEEGAVNCGE